MSALSFEKLIIEAIDTQTDLIIEVKTPTDGSIELRFAPYLYGYDFLHLPFIWGYLPDQQVLYRFYLDRILAVWSGSVHFTLRPGSIYLYGSEEEHLRQIDGLDRRLYETVASNSYQ